MIRYISTKVKRVIDYKCEIYHGSYYVYTTTGAYIAVKLFGMFWIPIKRYTYHEIKEL